MSNFFIDTSSLAKRYLTETGSTWIRRQILPSSGNLVFIVALTPIEIFSVLARQQRDSAISSGTAQQLGRIFLKHLKTQYAVYALNEAVLLQARDLVQRHPLRTLDAIQLSCAIEIRKAIAQAVTFIASDRALIAAARAEGFTVDSPYLHP